MSKSPGCKSNKSKITSLAFLDLIRTECPKRLIDNSTMVSGINKLLLTWEGWETSICFYLINRYIFREYFWKCWLPWRDETLTWLTSPVCSSSKLPWIYATFANGVTWKYASLQNSNNFMLLRLDPEVAASIIKYSLLTT